jgi:sugar phosphate isomerase/epimerase
MKLGLYIDIKHGAVLPYDQFDFIEENVQTLLVPEADEAIFRERLAIVRSLGRPVLAANRLLPADLRPVGPVIDEARLQRWGKTVFRRAEEVGVQRVVWGSGASRRLADDFPRDRAREQFIRAVASFAPFAERHGVTIVIEPVCRTDSNFIRSLAEGADIVQAVGHPNVRLLADNYHMDIEGEPATEIERFANVLEHIHVSEIKRRAIPGTTDYDLRPYLRALKNAGYNGTLAIEPEWIDVNTEPARALTALRAQMADAGLN